MNGAGGWRGSVIEGDPRWVITTIVMSVETPGWAWAVGAAEDEGAVEIENEEFARGRRGGEVG